MDVVGGKHFVGHVALVYIDVRPLTTLRLVARHGIRIFYLQGVIVRVSFQLLEAVGLSRDVGIVEHHLLEEMLTLLLRQGRCFGLERIGERRHLNLVIVIVGELKPKVDEMEAIEVAAVSDALNDGHHWR